MDRSLHQAKPVQFRQKAMAVTNGSPKAELAIAPAARGDNMPAASWQWCMDGVTTPADRVAIWTGHAQLIRVHAALSRADAVRTQQRTRMRACRAPATNQATRSFPT